MTRLTVNIDEHLRDNWGSVIQYHVNYLLTPLEDKFNEVEINFFQERMPNKEDLWYRCEINYQYLNDNPQSNTIYSHDGGNALMDALSRVRRNILRRR